ncbi:MAG: hypothetical protein ABSB52_02360 [Acidimicrobiales bacterium]|jgi:hypothetical protein
MAGSTREAIAAGFEGPPAADETDPEEPEPNGKLPEPNGDVPDPKGDVPEPNGELGELPDGDVDVDCQATRPMPNPAARPITSSATTNHTVVG